MAQLASNYSSFFERFTQILSALADSLPQYDQLLHLCKVQGHNGNDKLDPNVLRMRAHIQLVYEDIFEILQVAAGIFTKPDGRQSTFALRFYGSC